MKYVRNFKAYKTIITEYINIQCRSIDILDMMLNDRLSNIRMDLVDKPIDSDRK